MLAVGCPCYVGEIAVGGFPCLQIHGFLGVQVIHPHGYLMAGLSCHGVFVGFGLCHAVEDIHLRIVCHHALVHAIECHLFSIRTPEDAFLYTELVAVHHLAIHQFTTAVGGQLSGMVVGGNHIQLVVAHKGSGFRLSVPLCFTLVLAILSPYHGALLPIVKHPFLAVVEKYHCLVFVGVSGVHGAMPSFAQVFDVEQRLLLATLQIHGATLLGILKHQLVAPPCEVHGLGPQIEEIFAAKVQVFQCK